MADRNILAFRAKKENPKGPIDIRPVSMPASKKPQGTKQLGVSYLTNMVGPHHFHTSLDEGSYQRFPMP